MNRREFLKKSIIISGGISLSGISILQLNSCERKNMPFQISLAEWSLHRTIRSKKIDHLDFFDITKNKFGLSAVEYVNVFFFDKANDSGYLNEMKIRADDLGIKSLLIMCDSEGDLGDPDPKQRTKAIENHYKWVDAAKFLGCHSIRVNARSTGSYDEQIKLATDGLQRLTEFAKDFGINIIVENHGGLSSNGSWLSKVIQDIDHPMCGTLPDFGNFKIDDNKWYDRYKGVSELMPFAKGVSAKSNSFDHKGNETQTDYYKMIKIVLASGYDGYIGIEYEGNELGEMEGILATKELLERVGISLA
ncbi:MAG: sugar phosphate isomerase/epimerase family protein [Candidatus Neomarinimicrobiota bacterium]|nr:sugar phosphate isomerase/epimerase family protein [Candidatus Neomarinimicrobiota bacterium]